MFLGQCRPSKALLSPDVHAAITGMASETNSRNRAHQAKPNTKCPTSETVEVSFDDANVARTLRNRSLQTRNDHVSTQTQPQQSSLSKQYHRGGIDKRNDRSEAYAHVGARVFQTNACQEPLGQRLSCVQAVLVGVEPLFRILN